MMNRREKQLQDIREKKLVETTSKIYSATFTEVLFEADVSKEDIKYILSQVMEKAENLTRGYIDVNTYVESVQEKTGIMLTEEE